MTTPSDVRQHVTFASIKRAIETPEAFATWLAGKADDHIIGNAGVSDSCPIALWLWETFACTRAQVTGISVRIDTPSGPQVLVTRRDLGLLNAQTPWWDKFISQLDRLYAATRGGQPVGVPAVSAKRILKGTTGVTA